MIAETCPLILPIHRDLDALREDASRRGQDRHHAARHRPRLRGQGRPPRDPRLRPRPARRHGPAARPPVRASRRAARRLRRAAGRPRAPACATSPRSPASSCPSRRPVWRDLDAALQRGQAHPVRGRAGRAARRRPRHLSVRHLVQHRRRDDRLGQRHRPVAARASCSASSRPTPRASARAPSRPSRTMRSARSSASAATSSAPSPAASAAAAGSTRCWCARRSRSAASPASR